MGDPDHRVDPKADPRGVRIGKYQLLRRLAVGGMAELFLARTTGLEGFEKIVVLKRILPHLAGNAEFVEMFLHEARLAATLEHPNVVHVSDFGKAGRDYFFVMAYVHGKDLLTILRAAYAAGQRLPLAHAVTIAIGMATGLHYAHEHVGFDGRPLGIVHRDDAVIPAPASEAPPPPPKPERRVPPAAWALGATAVVGLGVGIGFGATSLQATRTGREGCTEAGDALLCEGTVGPDLQRSRTHALVSDISFAVAGAAAVGAIVVMVIHARRKQAGQLAVVPHAGPGGAAAMLVHRF